MLLVVHDDHNDDDKDEEEAPFVFTCHAQGVQVVVIYAFQSISIFHKVKNHYFFHPVFITF